MFSTYNRFETIVSILLLMQKLPLLPLLQIFFFSKFICHIQFIFLCRSSVLQLFDKKTFTCLMTTDVMNESGLASEKVFVFFRPNLKHLLFRLLFRVIKDFRNSLTMKHSTCDIVNLLYHLSYQLRLFIFIILFVMFSSHYMLFPYMPFSFFFFFLFFCRCCKIFQVVCFNLYTLAICPWLQ